MNRNLILGCTLFLSSTSLVHSYKAYAREKEYLNSRWTQLNSNNCCKDAKEMDIKDATLLYKYKQKSPVEILGHFIVTSSLFGCGVTWLSIWDHKISHSKSMNAYVPSSANATKSSVTGQWMHYSNIFFRRTFIGISCCALFFFAHLQNVNTVTSWLRMDREVESLYLLKKTSEFLVISQTKYGRRCMKRIPISEQENLRMYMRVVNVYDFFDIGYKPRYAYNKEYVMGQTGFLLNGSGQVVNVPLFTSLLFQSIPEQAIIYVNSSEGDAANGFLKLGSIQSLQESKKWHVVLDGQKHLLLLNQKDKWFLGDAFCKEHDLFALHSTRMTIDKAGYKRILNITALPLCSETGCNYVAKPSIICDSCIRNSMNPDYCNYTIRVSERKEIYAKLYETNVKPHQTVQLHLLYVSYLSAAELKTL
jgi:hypothetical protein